MPSFELELACAVLICSVEIRETVGVAIPETREQVGNPDEEERPPMET
jgi:hypothetical protein